MFAAAQQSAPGVEYGFDKSPHAVRECDVSELTQASPVQANQCIHKSGTGKQRLACVTEIASSLYHVLQGILANEIEVVLVQERRHCRPHKTKHQSTGQTFEPSGF